ncbi:hypothetical protein HB364_16985 [Pseudoflavitalea sp. X16]|uniref:IPT/TIG domain-containing protein n=1 Tax=Paraflavitalea devenefica TaxID=2716334 RepID=UPI00141FE6D1|nr:IPT/TIG domain-containing protein [Paraflavitalea devenefica]NII26787.1 hypothetical protein [Paraflavitalea devenefica]
MKKTILGGVIVLLTATACKKEKAEPIPFITHVYPLQGPHGAEVRITGRYLGASVGNTDVRFNHVKAEVVSVTDTLLKVKVPKGAETGDITIVSRGRKIRGPEFNYEYTVTVSTVAGNGIRGFTEGNAKEVSLYSPGQMVFDQADNLYFLDQAGAAIRKMNPAGALTTFAGNGTGTETPVDGTGANARFGTLKDICFDARAQVLYAVDFRSSASGSRIIKVTPEGNLGKVNTLFGGGAASWGYLDDNNLSNAKFRQLSGCVTDGAGNLYVMDMGNYCIRKIAFDGTGVSTLAGKGGAWGHADGQGAEAMFTEVSDISITPAGDLLAPEWGGNYIRKITLTGLTSTWAGNGVELDSDGALMAASVNMPLMTAADKKGNVYVITGGLNRLRIITAAGRVITLLNNSYGYQDGSGTEAKFQFMSGIAVDSKDHVFVADQGNRRIRKIIVE